MSDVPVPAIPLDVIRQVILQELPAAIQAANLPSVSSIQQMIERAVDPIKQETTAQLHGVDAHLRSYAQDMSGAITRFDAVTIRFENLMIGWSEDIGRQKAAQENNLVELGSLREWRRELVTENKLRDNEIQLALRSAANLHHDIHGNASEPNAKSLYALLNEMRGDMRTRFDAQEAQLKEHAEYIASRRNFEARAKSALMWVWGQKVGKALVVSNIILIIGGVFNFWPSVANGLVTLVEALVK